MSWWDTVPAFLLTFVFVFAPGSVLAYFIGARGIALAGIAPLLSVSIVGVAGIASGLVGMAWSAVPVVLTTAAAATIAWALRRFAFRRPIPAHGWGAWSVWAGAFLGLAIGAALNGRRLLQVIGNPENFAQRFDNVFHLNAIRFIMDSGNASSLTLGTMTGADGGSAIYPSAWHSVAALIAQLSGSNVVVAENVFNVFVGSVIWPAGAVFLVYQIIGPRPLALAISGSLSAGFAAFPISIMDFGPLYPNILSYALVPAAVAIVIGLCRLSGTAENDLPTMWLLLLVAVPGLALSQTNGLLSLVAFALPLGLWVAGREFRMARTTSDGSRRMAVVVTGAILGILAFVLIWKLLRPLENYDGWAPFTTQAGAIGEAVTNAPIGRAVTWAVSVLALIGIYRVIRANDRVWILLCWLVPVVLYVTTASSPKGQWRMLLTGGWYQDSYRLAALLPIFAIVLATIGSLFIWDRTKISSLGLLHRLGFDRSRGGSVGATAVFGTVFLTFVVAVTQYGTMGPITMEAAKAYVMDAQAPIVDPDELAVIRRLSSTVPEDAVIAVNPWNGSSLAYALSGRKVTAYHMFSAEDPDRRMLEEGIGSAPSGSTICAIAQDRRVGYILDFGSTFLANSAASKDYPGVVDVVPSAHTEVIDSQGHARLLRIAC